MLPAVRVCALLTLVACGAAAPARAPTVRTKQAEESAIGPPALCRLSGRGTMACDRPEVEALLAPARGRLEQCRSRAGGALTVRVRDGGGKLVVDALPGSSLDPRQRQCVLDALSAVSTSDNPTLWSGGVGIPPTGFTSLVTVEWGR